MAKENILQTRVEDDLVKKINKELKKEGGMTTSLWLRRLIVKHFDSVIRMKIK